MNLRISILAGPPHHLLLRGLRASSGTSNDRQCKVAAALFAASLSLQLVPQPLKLGF
jgi:hypothetical protein